MYKYYTLKYVHVFQSAVPIFLVGIQNSNAQCMHRLFPIGFLTYPLLFWLAFSISNAPCVHRVFPSGFLTDP